MIDQPYIPLVGEQEQEYDRYDKIVITIMITKNS